MMKKNRTIKKLETTVLAGGCFWCLDAAYSRIRGVERVLAGYAGGDMPNPDYEMVSTGETGHAETVRIDYDPSVVSFEDILHIFFIIHDPTTPNRQGNDIGTQYRSLILYANEEQQKIAKKVINEINEDKIYSNPIVTELKPLDVFYPAEEYHQKYYEKNPEQAYCQIVIAPKLGKLREKYGKFYKETQKGV